MNIQEKILSPEFLKRKEVSQRYFFDTDVIIMTLDTHELKELIKSFYEITSDMQSINEEQINAISSLNKEQCISLCKELNKEIYNMVLCMYVSQNVYKRYGLLFYKKAVVLKQLSAI
jgi:hypothetical protein